MNEERIVYTIGYGGHTAEQFVDLLREHDVRIVVDVRQYPERASMGIFMRAKTPEKGVQGLLARAGIGYIAMTELGNPFRYERDWRSLYERFLNEEEERLLSPLKDLPAPLCLLCAEKKVCDCHRQQIAERLEHRYGWKPIHLEGERVSSASAGRRTHLR